MKNNKTKNQDTKLLLELKKDIAITIKELNRKLDNAKIEMDEVNRLICNTNGHDFSPWLEGEEKDDFGEYYYTRMCLTCHKKETTFVMPDNYTTVNKENNKVYTHYRKKS